jgi:hypothetical protein
VIFAAVAAFFNCRPSSWGLAEVCEKQMSTIYERTEKESYLDIIYYEWNMLNFAFEHFKLGKSRFSQPQWNLLIEGFLLHYRNLIRFFSGKEHRTHKGDLSTMHSEIWANRNLTEDETQRIKVPALALDAEYHSKISKYLQHCTIDRITPAEWDLERMHAHLGPIFKVFEHAFPNTK